MTNLSHLCGGNFLGGNLFVQISSALKPTALDIFASFLAVIRCFIFDILN